MKYIEHKDNHTYVHLENKTICCKVVPETFVKELCLARLFSYEGMRQAVKLKLNIKTNIPIYVTYDLILIPTGSPRQKETIWINYAKIKDYRMLNYHTRVTFTDDSVVTINFSIKSLNKKFIECEKIINHLKTEKMSVYNMWLITFSSINIWQKSPNSDIITTINTIINLLEELYGKEND